MTKRREREGAENSFHTKPLRKESHGAPAEAGAQLIRLEMGSGLNPKHRAYSPSPPLLTGEDLRALLDATHGGNNGRLRVTEVWYQRYTVV